ncbi:hypothetical protein NUSPORA_02493 [Nucleospora cyclopteri]
MFNSQLILIVLYGCAVFILSNEVNNFNIHNVVNLLQNKDLFKNTKIYDVFNIIFTIRKDAVHKYILNSLIDVQSYLISILLFASLAIDIKLETISVIKKLARTSQLPGKNSKIEISFIRIFFLIRLVLKYGMKYLYRLEIQTYEDFIIPFFENVVIFPLFILFNIKIFRKWNMKYFVVAPIIMTVAESIVELSGYHLFIENQFKNVYKKITYSIFTHSYSNVIGDRSIPMSEICSPIQKLIGENDMIDEVYSSCNINMPNSCQVGYYFFKKRLICNANEFFSPSDFFLSVKRAFILHENNYFLKKYFYIFIYNVCITLFFSLIYLIYRLFSNKHELDEKYEKIKIKHEYLSSKKNNNYIFRYLYDINNIDMEKIEFIKQYIDFKLIFTIVLFTIYSQYNFKEIFLNLFNWKMIFDSDKVLVEKYGMRNVQASIFLEELYSNCLTTQLLKYISPIPPLIERL